MIDIIVLFWKYHCKDLSHEWGGQADLLLLYFGHQG